jgi:hypothetical protein
MLEKHTETRSLKYEFTAEELHDLSAELANKTKELGSITEEKKAINKGFTTKINAIKEACIELSNQVSDGYEYRDVECEVEFHKPEQGKKTYIRKDNNTVAAVEAMTDYDWNLFNQPEDAEAF